MSDWAGREVNAIVARTEGYTHAAEVRPLRLVQGPFSVTPCLPRIPRRSGGGA
jgi:hypothetical protein